MSSPDYRLELERLAIQRGVLLNELAIARQAAELSPHSGHDIVPSSRAPEVITVEIARVDAQIEQTTKDLALARQELNDLVRIDDERKRIENFADLAQNAAKIIDPDLPPTLNTEVQIAPGINTDQAFQAAETPSPLDAMLMMGALAAGVLTSKQQEIQAPEAPQPAERALEPLPQPAAPQERSLAETGIYQLPGGAAFPEQPAAILAMSQQVRMDVDPAIAAIDEKYEQKKQELDGKLATLQEKFDERHADKSADEKQALQAKLDQQFDELRAQLEKAQEQERQRALDEQTRQMADLARNRDDGR
ncbi:hypothetical protein BSY238_2104 [Methyloversatilis sp. RAC08]|uniref:hypothetical protein n=1 Tax=Methyloversatilis sp. RAC08 TaxID=1842540 RepID=UPI00083DF36A|nr:hypothetical protein [Methyloversatilis sp. RAC08]AOF80692.1 hypothetical protein BSY238_2104 [Methyloversatilis sp. RAC08]